MQGPDCRTGEQGENVGLGSMRSTFSSQLQRDLLRVTLGKSPSSLCYWGWDGWGETAPFGYFSLSFTLLEAETTSYHLLMDNPDGLSNSRSYQRTLQQKEPQFLDIFNAPLDFREELTTSF